MFSDFNPLLRSKNFKLLWASQGLSQLSINMLNFLFLIRVFSETGSNVAIALLWVSYSLPAIIIGPVAAASVDMTDRRKLLMITNFLQAIVVLLYGYSHRVDIFLIYAVAFIYSFLNQFYVPAELASLPSLVTKKLYSQANGFFMLTHQLALVVGFGVAGLLNSTIGFTKSLYLTSMMLFLAFISVSILPTLKPKESFDFESGFSKFFGSMIEGYKFIKNKRSVLAPFLLLVSIWVANTIIVINTPAIAQEFIGIDVNLSGILLVVPAAFGAGVAALAVPKILKRGIRKYRVIKTSLVLITADILFFTLITPGLPESVRLIFSAISLFLLGMGGVGVVIPSQTFLQEETPRYLRGRVFGNFWFVVTIATLFPAVFSAAISEVFGIVTFLWTLEIYLLGVIFVSFKYGDKFLSKKVV